MNIPQPGKRKKAAGILEIKMIWTLGGPFLRTYVI
jgi:hypothetical protein